MRETGRVRFRAGDADLADVRGVYRRKGGQHAGHLNISVDKMRTKTFPLILRSRDTVIDLDDPKLAGRMR